MVSAITIATFTNLPPTSSISRQSPPTSSFFFSPLLSRRRFLIPSLHSAVKIEEPSLIRRPTATVFDAASNKLRQNGGGGFDSEKTMSFWNKKQKKVRLDPEYIDLEDEILEETVPIVGFVRMLLHSGTYGSGDRLTAEHEKIVMERLLPHHPEYESKVGDGVDFITIGYHPDYESSRCLFIVRRDRELVDFSYWKCIENLIRKKHPFYVDTFIQRHFRRGGKIIP